MNTIYNEIQKEFGITKPMSKSEISDMVNNWAMLDKVKQNEIIRNSARPNREGFIL
jgi:hypothetical protein